MKFRFEADLPHQQAAIEAACMLFEGQPAEASVFTVQPTAKAGQLPLGDRQLGYGNRLTLLPEEIHANLQQVQLAGALPVEGRLDSMMFTVEMETGTGKTYVYLRTIFELNRRCPSSEHLAHLAA
ncbi:MAG: hypothetical protein DI568_16860 [Sphingomonas sp.]|nr:MAG: hypothetical protein DI568_16860 [Sphingomonas sp.]